MTNSSRVEKKRILHVGSYEVGKTLGNGSFGKVKLGTNVFTKEKVAIKFFNHRKFATAQQIENTHREIEIMKLLSHPNIVKLIDVIEKSEECTTYLIAEYVSGGELFDYIVANGTVKEKQARHFLRQIISAVEFCHANLIVHRDLKPENLLLDSNGNIKISDFGLSNMIEPGKLLDSFCGSPLYAAPEILLAERYVGPPIDVWSIGVILYALLCGHLPWNGETQAEISHNSIKGVYDEPQEISVDGRDIIRKMLNPNPRERITIAEIRKHAWINEGYNEPPESLLTIRQPVFEVRDEIIEQLTCLGFKNDDEIRRQILDNECCQVVAMYHLILDRKVAEELAEVKKNFATASPAAVVAPSSQSISSTPSPNKSHIGKPVALPHMNVLKLSPLRASSALAAIVEEEANEISAAEWNKIQHDEEDQSTPHEQEEQSELRESQTHPSPNYQHQHDSPQHQHDSFRNQPASPHKVDSPRHADFLCQAESPRQMGSPRRVDSPRLIDSPRQMDSPHQTDSPTRQHDTKHYQQQDSRRQPQPNQSQDGHASRGPSHHHVRGRSQLSNSVPGLGSVDRVRHRRFSVAAPNDQMIHNRSLPQTADEFGEARSSHPPRNHQRREPYQPPQPQDANPPPRGRKFSLDSRALAENKQMAQEASGGTRPQGQLQGPGIPRLVKGVFKSSTTTTRSPSEAAKLVKKVLSNSSFFVKRKSPFIFECLDDESGVKFQLEVCKISQLDMTGVHLKRLVGDIWLYKNMCTTLVNKLCL